MRVNQKLIGGEDQLRRELARRIDRRDRQKPLVPVDRCFDCISVIERADDVPLLDRRHNSAILADREVRFDDTRTPQRPLIFIPAALLQAVEHVFECADVLSKMGLLPEKV